VREFVVKDPADEQLLSRDGLVIMLECCACLRKMAMMMVVVVVVEGSCTRKQNRERDSIYGKGG
jgi:hypothetical protein